MNYPAMLSFACGFASLSLEILWVRLYGFSQSSTPLAFGFVLMAYLLGIAAGAHVGSRICRRVQDEAVLWTYSLFAVVLSAAFSVGLPVLFGVLSGAIDEPIVSTRKRSVKKRAILLNRLRLTIQRWWVTPTASPQKRFETPQMMN
ncbi:MAG: hypothetical protein EOO38_15095 [Cytophagaceae bacterium]|nr:MAG: hypothetical protein EOO38_15095 [Cytophagaceae bacterium]